MQAIHSPHESKFIALYKVTILKIYLWPTRKGGIKDPDLGTSEPPLTGLWLAGDTEGGSAATRRLVAVEKGGVWCSQLW
jgi:hypothetical protein